VTAGLFFTMHPVIKFLTLLPLLVTLACFFIHAGFISRSAARQRYGSQRSVFAERQSCQNHFITAVAVSLLSWLVWGLVAWAAYLCS